MAAGMNDQDSELQRLQALADDLRSALAAIYLAPHSAVSDRESMLSMLRIARWGLDRAEHSQLAPTQTHARKA